LILNVEIKSKDLSKDNEQTFTSKLTFIDLAGSEKNSSDK